MSDIRVGLRATLSCLVGVAVAAVALASVGVLSSSALYGAVMFAVGVGVGTWVERRYSA